MNVHRTDRISLGFGLTFLMLVLWWLLIMGLDVAVPTAGWFIAGGLILFGILGLVTSLQPRRKEEPVSAPPVPEPEDW
jgi:hypothetical protein